MTRSSPDERGGYFGGRDHTIVMSTVRTVTADCKDEPDIARQLHPAR